MKNEQSSCETRSAAGVGLFASFSLPILASGWLRHSIELGRGALVIALGVLALVASAVLIAFLVLLLVGRPEQTKRRIVFSLIIGLVTGAIVGGSVALKADRVGAYGSQAWSLTRQVCEGSGIAEAPAYAPGSGPATVAGVDLGAGQWWSGMLSIPKAWRPAAVEEMELVLCLGAEEELTVQTCSYGNGATRTRVQYQRRVVLREAHTGAAVSGAEADLKGSMPSACPTSVTSSSSTSGTIFGGSVGVAQCSEWLKPYVGR